MYGSDIRNRTYDRYRGWKGHSQFILEGKYKSIEDQVLDDLAHAKNETEKLEILDSYAALNKRQYRDAMIDRSLNELVLAGAQLVDKLLRPVIGDKFLDVVCPMRPIPGGLVEDKVSVVCSRCKKEVVEGENLHTILGSNQHYIKKGEYFICTPCLLADPDYKRDHKWEQ